MQSRLDLRLHREGDSTGVGMSEEECLRIALRLSQPILNGLGQPWFAVRVRAILEECVAAKIRENKPVQRLPPVRPQCLLNVNRPSTNDAGSGGAMNTW